MEGIAYGARSVEGNPFEGGQPLIDVALWPPSVSPEEGRCVLVVSEEPYASDIAEMIAEAERWEDLPVIEFEPHQIVGVGR